MSAYFRFVLRHRVIVGIVLLGVTLLAVWSASRAVFASSLEKLFFGESPAYTEYVERVEAFGTEEVNLFGFDLPDMLQAEQIERLRRVEERIEAIDDFGRVHSVTNAQRITSQGDTLLIDNYADVAFEDPTRIQEMLNALRADPLTSGVVISSDGQATVMLLEVLPDPTRPAEVVPRIIEQVIGAFEAEGFARSDLHSAGFMVTINELVEQTSYSIGTIFPFVMMVLLVTVWLMFRRLWPAAISGLVSFIGVLWTVGFAVQLDREINVLIAIVPAVILIVGFSDVVHLCSAYLLELEGGTRKRDAIVRSAEDVGRACFFTSATTFAGFVSLSLIPTPMFRFMGLILGFGVAVALLIAMTLAPIIFSFMPQPKPLRRGATSWVQDLLDGLLGRMQHFATARAKTVIAVSSGLFVLAIVGMTQLEIETDFEGRLAEDNPIRTDLRWYEDRFAGTTGLDIFIEVPDRDGLLDPNVFLEIAALQDDLTELAPVDTAVSLVDLMRLMYAAYDPQRAEVEPLPTTRAGLFQLLELFEQGRGRDLNRLVDFNRQHMRILLRLNDAGVRGVVALANEAASMARQRLGDEVTVTPSGLVYLLGDWLDEILAGQRNGLILSFVLITIMMIIALKSLRAALLSMIPNVFPLFVLGGLLGVIWSSADSDVMVIALMAIGIGVDDTVHFLVRFRIESSRTRDQTEALRRTFNFAGRAIVMTTIILVLGFAPFVTSDYFSTSIMGSLLPLCLIIALLADLMLVPALAKVGLIRFREGAVHTLQGGVEAVRVEAKEDMDEDQE